MPINAHPEFVHAEKAFHKADSPEEQLKALETMISFAPSHKGAENLRAQLTTKLKKLKIKIVKAKKTGKSTQVGIKKHDMQAAIVGKTNSGKSALLDYLTNAKPKISQNKFVTTKPQIGIMTYLEVPIQLIEVPAIESEKFDRGVANTADTLLLTITEISQIAEIDKKLTKSRGKKIIVFTHSDTLTPSEKRKISSQLKSKKYNFILISVYTNEGMEELKEKIFKSFNNIRVFTKEPGKQKSAQPVILKPRATVYDISEKILKGFSKRVKKTRIWGPSSKFSGQGVGLKHKLKDMDTVEFTTK